MEDLFAQYIGPTPRAGMAQTPGHSGGDGGLRLELLMAKEEVTPMPGDNVHPEEHLMTLFTEVENRKALAGAILRNSLEVFDGRKVSNADQATMASRIASTCSVANTRKWLSAFMASKDGSSLEGWMNQHPSSIYDVLHAANSMFTKSASRAGTSVGNAYTAPLGGTRVARSSDRTAPRRYQHRIGEFLEDQPQDQGRELTSRHRTLQADGDVDDWRAKWLATL